MNPCVHLLIWPVVLMVLDDLVHKLNPLRHAKLHLWKTYVACLIVLGKTLLCLIFSLLLYWIYMHYCICNVLLLVLCTIYLLHVVPMIHGCLDYYKWLFLSQVGLTVCGWNKIIQIVGCRLIGGEEFFIFWENLDWLLSFVIVCLTIED